MQLSLCNELFPSLSLTALTFFVPYRGTPGDLYYKTLAHYGMALSSYIEAKRLKTDSWEDTVGNLTSIEDDPSNDWDLFPNSDNAW